MSLATLVTPLVPAGFVSVSKDIFFQFVNPRDICLSARKESTIWETRSRTEIGRTFPGYANSNLANPTYMLTQKALDSLNLGVA